MSEELKTGVLTMLSALPNIDLQTAENLIPSAVLIFLDRTNLQTQDLHPITHAGVIASVTEYLYNRQGTLGSLKESHAGVQFDYTSDLPEEVLKRIRAYRRVKW